MIEIESSSKKKLELQINVILTTIPISILVSCKEYELIKQKIDYDNDIPFVQCFKINSKEFIGNEEINFELLNYNNQDTIDFYLSAKSLENNTFSKPHFDKIKQTNNFKITIPKIENMVNETEIPRLNCVIEVFINSNYVIYILIDSLIKPIVCEIKMYDYYLKEYRENESTIYLNESVQDIFKEEGKKIKLYFILISSFQTSFKVNPDQFHGGRINSFEGKIENDICEFNLDLEFEDCAIIETNTNCQITILLGDSTRLTFKIKFEKPSEEVYCEPYYKHFMIKGKNFLNDNWKKLDGNNNNEKYKFYVTPFNFKKIEISYYDFKNMKFGTIKDLYFYNLENLGKIKMYNIYYKKFENLSWDTQPNLISIPFCVKYNELWYPLIKNNEELDTWNIQYYEKWENIQKQVCSEFKKWILKVKMINSEGAFNEITKHKEFNKFEKSRQFYEDCEKIINHNLDQGIQKFKNNLEKYKNDLEEGEISFETLAYYIMNDNKYRILTTIYNCLPKNFQEYFKEDYINYYHSNEYNAKNLYLYNFILKLRDYFIQQEEEFFSLNKKIIITVPDIEKEQKNMLDSYYQKITNIRNYRDYTPKILINYKKYFENFDKDIIKEDNKSQKYLIIGNECKEVDINTKQEYDKENKDSTNLKLDNSVTIVLPEIDLSKYKEHITLNNIYELLNRCIIGARIFPAYLKIAIINENENNIKYAEKYFDTLYTMYCNKRSNDNSIIKEKVNEFISSFQEMIVKLKDAGINFEENDFLNSIKKSINNQNTFIKPPEKIEPKKQSDEWENKKIIEQKIEQEYKNEIMKKIEINNIKSEQLDNLNSIMNIKKNNVPVNPSQENSNISNIPKMEDKEEEEEDEIGFIDMFQEMENIDYMLDYEEDNHNKKKMDFISSENVKDNIYSKTSSEHFENLEKKFDEDYALKYIVDKMKNKVNKNDLYFKYEVLKAGVNGYNPKNLYHSLDSQKKENEILSISSLIENSRFLTSKLIATVSQFNVVDEKYEILFNKIEANIIFDLARTISNENRYFNMLMVCGLANALYSLKISYSLSIIGDSDFKVRIKNIDEPHSELILQKLYDCCFIKRNVTQLPTCLRYFIDKYPIKEEFKYRVYYIFTNGFDEELKKCKAWENKIFNDNKNSFAFIFTKSQALEKEINVEYKNYLLDIWKEFEEESKNLNCFVSVSQISFKDIEDNSILSNLTENLSKVLLREKDPTNKDSSPKLNSLFNIDKSSKLTDKYISLLRSLIGDQLNSFNELYIKKSRLPPYICDNQKDNQTQYKLFCQRTGKIIRYDKLNEETTRSILRLVRDFREEKEKIKMSQMNIIFKPNLPTQSILVEEGTHLDITELIKYSINRVPNPRLYREVRDGFIKNYAVTVIIDTSVSCLNELCIIHSIQTLRILLSAILYENIPCLDIVIAREKEPIILCSEKSGNEILSQKSPFWAVLFSCLEGQNSIDLASAIKAGYNLNRARRADYTNYIFVLTDGLYCPSQREKIIGVVNNCYSKNINIFGIGIGIYPIGIEKLFPQVVYSQNPSKLIEGISLLFGDISKYKDIKMKYIMINPNKDKILENCREINNHINEPKFKHLKEELSKIKISLESFPFFNPELNKNKDGSNPEGENSSMYERNFFKGQHILIAMFFSSDLKSQGGEAITEDEKKINPKFIATKDDQCIASVLGYYGYNISVVTNYEEAINELCKKDKKQEDKCKYNSLWVISGQEVPDLPSNNGDINAPFYVEQFVDCAIQFWKKGGSLVLMGENDPHNFQVNFFLKKLVFPDGKKVSFKIGGNHPGRKILTADYDSNKLEKKQTFNAKIQEVNHTERKSLANNLSRIFEGATLAYAIGDINPFIPFSRDSDGGINSLFYNGLDINNDGNGEGDIFIDCAYTKFFLDMEKSGTNRYLQNIAGFIGSAERRYNIGHHPRNYRPDKVNFTLNKDQQFFYKYPKIPFDVIYLIDATASMDGTIENVKTYCVEIANILKNQMMLYDFQFGAIFYRDPIDSKKDKNEYYNLTSNIIELQNYVKGMKAEGGNDTPEDWVGGYTLALNNINWRNGNKLIIHITDSGAHGTDYTRNDKYPKEGSKLDNCIKQCSENNIFIVGFKIGNEPMNSFKRVKNLYNSLGNNNFKVLEFDQNKKDPGYFTDLVVNAIKVT